MVALAVALMSLTAQGMPLCSYQAPETLLLDATTSFSYQYFDDANTPGTDVNTGRVDFSFSRLRDAETYGSTLRLNGLMGLSDFLPTQWMSEGTASYRYYVSSSLPLFGFGGIHGLFNTSQTQLGLEIQSGFGFGRFGDVTPLAKAMLVDINLQKNKVTYVPLPDSVLTTMAQTIGSLSAENSIETVVALLESIIETTTGLQLDARTLLMIEDVVANSDTQRYCGFTARAGLGYELLDPYGGPQSFLLALSADAAYAPDPNGQMQWHLSFSGPFDVASENTLTGSFSYEVMVSDANSLEANYSFQRIQPAGGVAVTSHVVTCNWVIKVAAVDTLVGFSIARTSEDAGWSITFSLSTAMDLI